MAFFNVIKNTPCSLICGLHSTQRELRGSLHGVCGVEEVLLSGKLQDFGQSFPFSGPYS